MPIVDTRTALKNALASVTANVYDHVPEAVIPPALVVVPDSPYAELETISKSTIRTKLNYTLTRVSLQRSSTRQPRALMDSGFGGYAHQLCYRCFGKTTGNASRR
jgi:hypothetical protein